MKTCGRSVLQLIIAGLALSAASFAAEDATLYIVHGIPGRDISATTNPSLSVDVFLNDSVCYLRGTTFGASSGPLTLPAGDYDIKISMANSLAPCTNSPILETTAKLTAGSTTTAVAALNGSGIPTVLSFIDNFTPVKAGDVRFTIANAADAPVLTVTLTQEFVKQPNTETVTVTAGKEISVALPFGTYAVQATTSGSTTPLVTQAVFAPNQAADLLYFVGAASNGSLTLVSRQILDVF
jgi:hypothetical protein